MKAMPAAVPFVVFSLPRSRSAWTAHYLAGGQGSVGHDTLIWCDSLKDFQANFSAGMLGTCETGGAWGWKLIRQRIPQVKFVTLRRPLSAVLASLRAFGLSPSEPYLAAMDSVLDVIETQPGTLRVECSDLDSAWACDRLHQFCLGETADEAWTQRLQWTNIQVDMPQRMGQLLARQSALTGLRLAADAEMARLEDPVSCLN